MALGGLAKDPVTGLNKFQQQQKDSQAASAAVGGYKPPAITPPSITTNTTPSTPPKSPLAPIANAATSTSSPSTGYGGATYGSSGAANQAITANGNKLSSDPNFLASEIARTQAVIAERQKQGLDTSAQQKYLTQNLGYTPQTSQIGTAAGSTGVGGTVTNPLTGITSVNNAPNEQPFAQTVGNSYNNVNPNTGFDFSPGAQAGVDPTAEEKAYLQMQLDALNAQNTSNLQSTSYQIDKNKQALQEQLDALNRQNVVQTDATQQFNNRLGGLYSGGQQFQQGLQAEAYANQTGALNRDTAAQNQQLLNQYGTQAASIADQIKTLQTASPDILRERLQSWINNERQYGLDYANTFGNLNGQNTQSQNNQNFQQGIDVGQLTGQYGGKDTVAQQAQNLADKQANWNAYQDIVQQTGNLGKGPSETWSSLVSNANLGADTLAGKQWTAQQKQQIFENNQAIQKFEEDKKQNGLQYALQQNSQALANDDNLRQWAALDFDQASKSDPNGGTNAYNGISTTQAIDSLSKIFKGADGKIPSDDATKQSIFNQVINLGMPESNENQALIALGLTKADIDKFDAALPK